MMPDYPLGQTLDFKFTTRAFATGIPTTLAGTPVVEIYEDNSLTQITAAETLTVDFDSVPGLHNLRVVATSGNGFESGKSYAAVLSAGTVSGVSVIGEVIAQFSIERSPALRPTTAARTLDVASTGEAGIDLGNTIGTLDAAQIGSNAITAAKIASGALNGKGDWALASVIGALADAAAAGDPTNADTLMAYAKQLINVLVGTDGVTTFPAEAAPGNAISLAEVIRAIHADVTGLNGAAMRGTDSAALASVIGGLADAAAAGDPTSSDTLMQYAKQLINVLVGTAGIGVFPAEAAPANGVSLSEVMRGIYADVTGLNGAAMRGTDSAALASLVTSARMSELDAGTAGKMANQVDIIQIDTTTDIPALIAALNDVATSDVLTQMNAALDTAISELGVAAPTATPTLRTGLMLLYMMARNKSVTQTSATDAIEVYNNAGTKIAAKLITDDGSDYTEAEMA